MRKLPLHVSLLQASSHLSSAQVPYSGGSSLEANFSAPYGGISIDFAFMDKIISLNDDECVPIEHVSVSSVADMVISMDVVVQPSVPWVGLNEKIQDSGLFFPVDPSPSVGQTPDERNT